MFVVSYCEHIPALEGLDSGSDDGARTGKLGPEFIALFEDVSIAYRFCQNIEKNWCPADRKLPSVKAFWYEVHEVSALRKHTEYPDQRFVAAFNRFGERMLCTYSASVDDALRSEKEYKNKKKSRSKNKHG